MEIREVLKKYGFTFHKQYGQNFLTDDSLLSRVANAFGEEKSKAAVEIGCGAGTLTRALSAAYEKVFALEIDRRLEPVLRETLSDAKNVTVLFQDVMKTDLSRLEKEIGCEYDVVANLPYYVTTPVLMKFLNEAKAVKGLTLTVQKEVAERLAAKPGTAAYGAVTAAIDRVGEAEIVEIVTREKFTPAPNVDSAVVKIKVNREKFPPHSETLYRDVVRAAFGNRRKTLKNNLQTSFSVTATAAEEILTRCGISPTARGETLFAEDFIRLADELEKRGGENPSGGKKRKQAAKRDKAGETE